jgi:hypothetical protein
MSAEAPSRFNLSAVEIASYPWQDRLRLHHTKECNTYHEVFGRAAKESREASDPIGERVYSFLNLIASFYPEYDNRAAPYRSMLINSDGSRSLNPDDLTEQDLDALQGILPGVEDPEFRARVADVLWVCRKDFKAAQVAIAAFLESAQQLNPQDLWPPYIERLDRAAQLSAKKGFEVQRATVAATVEAAIIEHEKDPKTGLLCARLMGILLSLEEGDINRYIALSGRLARDFAINGEWHFSELYWQVAERWHRRSKDEAALQRCQIEAAECSISRGEACLQQTPPQPGSAAHWIGRGLEGLRRAKAEPARIKDVHLRFLSLQREALNQLEPIGFDPFEFPAFKENREEVQKAAIAHVSGLDFETALLHFAHIGNPTDFEKLKESERKNSKDSIWDKLFGANLLDRDGKVVDVMPAIGFNGEDSDQVAFRKKLVQTASMFEWPIAADWRIEPARKAISQEHPIRARDVAFLVMNNPFIRPGHEGLYLRGIQAGFFGDWVVAMHLLIPQLEASLRHVLQQHSVVTSTLDSDGTQKERDINQLLWDPNAGEIFGEDVLFDLRGILIERFGCNMRNELAHGLIHEAGFYRAEAVYLWWLTIRLCWFGFRSSPEELPEEP